MPPDCLLPPAPEPAHPRRPITATRRTCKRLGRADETAGLRVRPTRLPATGGQLPDCSRPSLGPSHRYPCPVLVVADRDQTYMARIWHDGARSTRFPRSALVAQGIE